MRIRTRRYFAEEGGGEGGGGNGGGNGAVAWYDTFKDPEVKTWVSSYKNAYPDPEAMATKALALERLLTADKANRAVIVPKDDAKPEEWKAFWSKFGVPEKVDGYKVPDGLGDDPLVGKFREFALSVNMPAKMFEGAMALVAGAGAEHTKNLTATLEAQAAKDFSELETEWGKDYDENTELARRSAKAFIPHDNPEALEGVLGKIEAAVGPKMMMKIFAAAGRGMEEHQFAGNDGPSGGGMITAEGARVRIKALRNDAEFTKKLLNGDTQSKAEWDKLHKIGYGD